uniref:DUF4371 domain-containing protein n=1 Tax=Pundamilia nyererei TaxID=303518 RepID=A0A3B4GZR3_9CICH
YMFTDIAGKPVCLISGANVAVIKEFNLGRHYQTKRQDKLKNLNAEQKLQKVEQKSQSEAVVKARFIVAEETAKSARHSEELHDEGILANVSLRRNTIADRVCEMATDLRTQLCERSKNFIAYSLAVDESIDMMDIAQLAIFIRVEEILNIKSIVTDMKLPWDKLVGLTTDEAPVLYGEKSGLVSRMRVKMQEENCTGELTAYHCIIHQETLCGKVLKMEHVMITVTLNHRQFQSFMREIDSEFADIPYHTEVRWLIHGHGMYDAVMVFQVKLSQMHQCNLSHFLCCQVMLDQIQMELRCNDTLKGKYDTEWPAQFISSIPEAMPSSVYMWLEPCVCFHLFFLGFLAASVFPFQQTQSLTIARLAWVPRVSSGQI